jgi:hypothetical protein
MDMLAATDDFNTHIGQVLELVTYLPYKSRFTTSRKCTTEEVVIAALSPGHYLARTTRSRVYL